MPRNYTGSELILRLVWGLVQPVFFRFSPRLLYGWRNFVLRIMGAKIGKQVKIYPSARIMYPWLLKVGDNTIISWEVKVYNLAYSEIGSNTIISQYSHLCGGTHDYRSVNFDLIRTGFKIGSHVWVAADAFVGPGVEVQDYAVIGARAVVVKNVDKNTLVGGNPAQIIKINVHSLNESNK